MNVGYSRGGATNEQDVSSQRAFLIAAGVDEERIYIDVGFAPARWELTNAPVAMVKGPTLSKETGKFERHDSIREIEADTMAQLEPKMLGGWQLLSVRAA